MGSPPGRLPSGSVALWAYPPDIASVAAVSEPARILLVVGCVAFKIGTGQLVEQHFITHMKKVCPPLAKVCEERLAMLQQTIRRAVERVVLYGSDIDSEQVGARGPLEPLPVQTPFQTWRQPSLDREAAQDDRPVRALATAPQALREKRVPVSVQRRRAVLGKENHLLFSACTLVKHAGRLLPRPMPRIAPFTRVEHMVVDRTHAMDAARLHNRPGTMLFPILLADTAFQKHLPNVEEKETHRPEGRSPLQGLFAMSPLIINGLRVPARQKKHFYPPVAEVGLREIQKVSDERYACASPPPPRRLFPLKPSRQRGPGPTR
jgi:hypothetical protein